MMYVWAFALKKIIDFYGSLKCMEAMARSRYTNVAIQAALKAGDVLRRGYGTKFDIDLKPGAHNFVTEYDKRAEEAIISLIHKNFPTHSILAEESGSIEKENTSTLWLIDPLDGTLNFTRNIPIFAVSIAVFQEGEIQVGVIYLPITQELFVAQKGEGAHLNGTAIKVSEISDIKKAVLVTGFPYDSRHSMKGFNQFVAIAQGENPIRDLGSAAVNLAYVAAGRFDAYWISYLQPWDMAAGKLLIEEAGGKVTHYDGSAHKIFGVCDLVGSNGAIHQKMVDHLAL